MSLLGKGVNKLFTSLGSLLKKIVELSFDLLGLIKFKISKKGYNVKEESSKKGKIAGRKIKNDMDKFAIKAQVGTDKGIIFLGKFLRLLTFAILKLFNTVSRNLYKASEKSKDKFTTYNISQDEKNKEKFIEFDNLIAKCNDIENYEEAAISNFTNNTPKNLENTIFSNSDNAFKNNVPKELDYSNDKNIQNKTSKETASDLDKTLFEFSNTYNNLNHDVESYKKEDSFVPNLDATLCEDLDFSSNMDKNKDIDIKEFIPAKNTADNNYNNDIVNKPADYDLDKTLFQDDANIYNSIKSKSFSKTLEDINSSLNNEDNHSYKDIDSSIESAESNHINDEKIYHQEKNIDVSNLEINSENLQNEQDSIDEGNNSEENISKKTMFNFLRKKEKDSSFDETFHGENYEFNSSIKLANENYSKNKKNNLDSSIVPSNNVEENLDKTQFVDLKSLREDSNKTQMINMDDFREAVNSRLHSSDNSTDEKINNSYKYSLDDDDESIRKFLNDD